MSEGILVSDKLDDHRSCDGRWSTWRSLTLCTSRALTTTYPGWLDLELCLRKRRRSEEGAQKWARFHLFLLNISILSWFLCYFHAFQFSICRNYSTQKSLAVHAFEARMSLQENNPTRGSNPMSVRFFLIFVSSSGMSPNRSEVLSWIKKSTKRSQNWRFFIMGSFCFSVFWQKISVLLSSLQPFFRWRCLCHLHPMWWRSTTLSGTPWWIKPMTATTDWRTHDFFKRKHIKQTMKEREIKPIGHAKQRGWKMVGWYS